MTTITDAMVEAALAAWHGVPVEMERQLLSPVKAKKMRAALEAAERAAWRPIAEAPKDGVALVYLPEAETTMQVGVFRGAVTVIGNRFSFDFPPATHFRPLPPPPEGDGK